MPCRDGGPTLEEERASQKATAEREKIIARNKRELDRVTRLLCGVMQEYGDTILAKQANLRLGDTTLQELETWWDKHQELDEKRKKR